jgi:hypothetical protein
MDLSKRQRVAGIWAGEVADPVGLPVNGSNPRGGGQGLRYQALLIMEPYWVQQNAQIPKPKFSAQVLGDYTQMATRMRTKQKC